MNSAKSKKAPPKDAASRTAAAKTLRTIDDPFFDDNGAFGTLEDPSPGHCAPLAGVGLGAFPGSGNPTLNSPSGSIPLGAGTSAQPGCVAPGEGGIREPFRPEYISTKLAALSRHAQNVARARQRLTNAIIGAVVLGITMLVLFTLAAFVFSGPRQNDSIVTSSSAFPSEDANSTEDYDDIEVSEGLLLKREMTPEEYDFHYYATIGANYTATAVSWKGEADTAIRTVETKSTASLPATSTAANIQRVHTSATRTTTRASTGTLENSRKISKHSLQKKLANTHGRVRTVLH